MQKRTGKRCQAAVLACAMALPLWAAATEVRLISGTVKGIDRVRGCLMFEYKEQCWYPTAEFSVMAAADRQSLPHVLPGMSVSLYGQDVSQVSRAVVHGPADLVQRVRID